MGKDLIEYFNHHPGQAFIDSWAMCLCGLGLILEHRCWPRYRRSGGPPDGGARGHVEILVTCLQTALLRAVKTTEKWRDVQGGIRRNLNCSKVTLLSTPTAATWAISAPSIISDGHFGTVRPFNRLRRPFLARRCFGCRKWACFSCPCGLELMTLSTGNIKKADHEDTHQRIFVRPPAMNNNFQSWAALDGVGICMCTATILYSTFDSSLAPTTYPCRNLIHLIPSSPSSAELLATFSLFSHNPHHALINIHLRKANQFPISAPHQEMVLMRGMEPYNYGTGKQ